MLPPRVVQTLRKVSLIGVAPIPVGHEVEITIYDIESGSRLFGLKKHPIKVPRVRDLETDIVYGHVAHHLQGSIKPNKVNVKSSKLREGLTPRAAFNGIVAACQITAVSNEEGFVHMETLLVIEVEERR